VASLAYFGEVFGSALFQSAVMHTIGIALAASAGCLLLGFTLALILSFVPVPEAGAVARLIDTFIALRTFLVALAFTFIYGSAGLLNMSLMQAMKLPAPPIDFLYSPWGVILAEITVYTPFAMRPLLATFSLIDEAQIEVAASLGARPWRIIRQIILPAAIPALLAGCSLCLLLTVNEQLHAGARRDAKRRDRRQLCRPQGLQRSGQRLGGAGYDRAAQAGAP
jgi:2-aminoethylphosphonate transport system permease protein